MNQAPQYMDMHAPPHISSGPSSYAQPAPHYQYPPQQPMQPASAHYGPPSSSYGGYYGSSVTSPHSAGPQMQSNLPLPAMMPSANPHQSYGPASGAPTHTYTSQAPYDTTGQIAPPGMKPRVTATLWEDEGSLCFQVEAKGVCVARREDNHFINGTKLLNVAGMTRGRRDGILKSEKIRHVVKIGPMHLKGVWIPFDRALEFANKEKITDILYPLFVHNIGGLLYNSENSSRTNAVVSANESRRRMDSTDSTRAPNSAPAAPPLHHHHSMQASVGGQVPSTPNSMTTSSAGPRPGLDRAHTFPTPPTSASSVLGMSSTNGSYEWNQQGMANGVGTNPPLSIDTNGNMNNTRSLPTTPATTPPGQSVAQMQPYSGHQSYDNKHNYYATTPSSQTGYAQQSSARYDGYKNDMGPPTAPNTGNSDSQDDHKASFSVSHPGADGGDQHENGYMSSNGAYGSARPEYAYNPASSHQQLSPDMNSSPHQANPGRGTPRTLPNGQPQWGGEYRTPPQSNPNSAVNPYPSSGYNPALKRRRDDDDQDGRPGSRETYSGYDTKRQKMAGPESFGMPLHAQPMPIKTGPMPGR